MRQLLWAVLSAVLLAGCQSSGASVDGKSCDPRATDSGLCVPGEYTP